MTFFYICEGCDCGCVAICHGEPKQPDNTVCLFPGRREGPAHKVVRPEWYRMVKARVKEC